MGSQRVRHDWTTFTLTFQGSECRQEEEEQGAVALHWEDMVQGGEEESAGSGRGCHRGRRETRKRGALRPREVRVPEVWMSNCWYAKRENHEIWPLDSATWRSLVTWRLDKSYFSGVGRIATLTRVGSRERDGSKWGKWVEITPSRSFAVKGSREQRESGAGCRVRRTCVCVCV